MLNNNKVLFSNEENFSYTSNNSNLNNINNQKLSNIDNSNFENPKRVVKSKVTSEDKTKFNNFISPNRFSCLNNYSQFENSIDFNKEIVNNVSKDSIDISCTKECSKEPVRDQIAPSKHLTVTSINSNEAHSKEPIRDRKIKTNRPNAPTTTIIGDFMIKKVFGGKLSRQLDNKHHVVVRSFGGAKTQCMEDYIKPTVKLAPKQIILHYYGTNNLPSNEDPETIAKNIMNLAKNIKTDTTKVAVLGIIPRRDTFNHKG